MAAAAGWLQPLYAPEKITLPVDNLLMVSYYDTCQLRVLYRLKFINIVESSHNVGIAFLVAWRRVDKRHHLSIVCLRFSKYSMHDGLISFNI